MSPIVSQSPYLKLEEKPELIDSQTGELLNREFDFLKDLQKTIIVQLEKETIFENHEGKFSILPASFLQDITTGFGKSYIQIIYAYILERLNIPYNIVLPERLIDQFKHSISEIINDRKVSNGNAIANSIINTIQSHENFIEKDGYKKIETSKSITIIDEIHELLDVELYWERFLILLRSINCTLVLSTATAPRKLYDHHKPKELSFLSKIIFKNTPIPVKEKKTHIISVSHSEKLKCFNRRDNYITRKKAASLIRRVNNKSKLLPYIILNIASISLIIFAKIYFNTVAVRVIQDYLIKIGLYNFYIYIFAINPVVGLISLFAAWIFIISPVNWAINKIANRDIVSLLLANLEDHHFKSAAYEDIFEMEETFVFHEDKSFQDKFDDQKQPTPYQIARIQQMICSPKAMQQLIMVNSDFEIIQNIYYGLCDPNPERLILQNGSIKSQFATFAVARLGKDLGSIYDSSSFSEIQRLACKENFEKAIAIASEKYAINKELLRQNVDFSDARQYVKYRALHGIINNALLIILQHNNKTEYRLESPLIFHSNYLEDIKDSIKKLYQDSISNPKTIGIIVTKYLKKNTVGIESLVKEHEIISAITQVISTVLEFSKNENSNKFYSLIFNRNTDKRLHDMMEKGDIYQIFDDILKYYDELKNRILIDEVSLKEHLELFLKENFFGEIDKNSLINQIFEALKQNKPEELSDFLKKNDLFTRLTPDEIVKCYNELKNRKDIDEANLKEHLALFLEKNSLTSQIFEVLKQNKPEELSDFFKKNDLFTKINATEHLFKFYSLREICKHLSIQFIKTKKNHSSLNLRHQVHLPEKSIEQAKALFQIDLLGTLVDSEMKMATGFDYGGLSHASTLSTNYLDPKLQEQAEGRLRGKDPLKPGFCRTITNNQNNQKESITGNCINLFKSTEIYRKLEIANLGLKLREELLDAVTSSSSSMKKNSKSDLELELSGICVDITKKNFERLYTLLEYDILSSKEKFTQALNSTINYLSNYRNKIKNANSIHWLYFLPYYIFYCTIKFIYYSWTSLDLVSFYISTYTITYNIKSQILPSAEQTYIDVIKNFNIEQCLKNYLIIEEMYSLLSEISTPGSNQSNNLSEKTKSLIQDFAKHPICLQTLKSILSLDEKFLLTILVNTKYVNTEDEAKEAIEKMKLLCQKTLKLDSDYEYLEYKETLPIFLNLAKELLALHAWYHDSCSELLIEKPKLLPEEIPEKSAFYCRNVGNPTIFLGSPSQFFKNKDSVEYRKNYGNTYKVFALYFIKWIIFIVILPQIPYCFLSIAQASAFSTILCALLFASLRYSAKIKEFIFNNVDSKSSELKLTAHNSLIENIEKSISQTLKTIQAIITTKLKTHSPTSDKNHTTSDKNYKLTPTDIEKGTYLSGIEKFFALEVTPIIPSAKTSQSVI